ncbi:MAG: hypothetical protein QXM12_02980 [Nitrososphaerota archaeon]
MTCSTCTESSKQIDPIYFSISVPLHARGWITEPKLFVLFEAPTTRSLTLRVVIADLNGKAVSDEYSTTIPAGTRVFSRDLGDFIDAQRTAKNIPAGIYTLIASVYDGTTLLDVVAFTVFLVNTAISITPREDIIDVVVIDKWTAMSVRASKYQPIPADERYTVFVVSRSGNSGRIEVYDGGFLTYDSGYHRYVQIRIKRKFTSTEQMFDYVFSNSYMPIFVAREFLREAEVRSKKELIPALMPFYISRSVMPGYIGAIADTENLEIVEEFLMFFGWFDWKAIFDNLITKLGIAGCVIGAGASVIATKGAAAPIAYALAKGCLMGGSIGAGIGILVETVKSYFIKDTTPPPPSPPPPPPPPPPPDIKPYQDEFDESKTALEELLTQWRDQGRITQAEFETAMKHLSTMKEMYEATIKDLYDYAETIYEKAWSEGWNKGYQEGYSRGRDEERRKLVPYALGSGAVGLVIGVLIGRR